MIRHAALTALAALTISIPATLPARHHDHVAATPSAPTMTFVDAPSDDERQMVEWAVERYLEADLQLPDLEISFPASCGGKAGRYHVGLSHVELCRPTHKLILHEFAHAWDDNSNIDREAFLERRVLAHWYEQPDQRSTESGGEQLAQIITWGLMDVDITARVSEWAGQPIAEQPRHLPGFDNSSPEILTDLFVQLTGSSPLSPAASMSSPPNEKRRAEVPTEPVELVDTLGADPVPQHGDAVGCWCPCSRCWAPALRSPSGKVASQTLA